MLFILNQVIASFLVIILFPKMISLVNSSVSACFDCVQVQTGWYYQSVTGFFLFPLLKNQVAHSPFSYLQFRFVFRPCWRYIHPLYLLIVLFFCNHPLFFFSPLSSVLLLLQFLLMKICLIGGFPHHFCSRI